MIALSNKDMNSIWEYVKQIRADYLWNLNSFTEYYSCSSFIIEQDNKNNIEKLTKLLSMSNVTEEVLDINHEKIKEGAKMFLYLKTCPSTLSLNLKDIFTSLDTYTVIMSTLKLLKSSKGKTLESMIKIFNSVSYEYGNIYSKISYEPTTKKLGLTKNLSILNGIFTNFVKRKIKSYI